MTENAIIRQHLGHGDGNRKVRIKQDGTVEYYGSTDHFDRQHDYWHYAGERDELLRDAKRTIALTR